MSLAAEWFAEVWAILLESGPYLLVGFLIAGLLEVLIPRAWIRRHLGGKGWVPIAKAALVGAPVPLCSCSVIPTAAQLRREGASPGATAAFLVATPETGVDSIGISLALLDPVMTVARPVSAIATAIGTGLAVGKVTPEDLPAPEAPAVEAGCCAEEAVPETSARSEPRTRSAATTTSAATSSGVALQAGTRTEVAPALQAGCCDGPPEAAPEPAPELECCAAAPEPAPEPEPEGSCCHPGDEPGEQPEGAPLPKQRSVLARAAAYAYGPLMADLTPWFLVGFALSATLALALPNDFFGGVVPGGLPAMLIMLVAGLPLYVCATASTPIAATLIAKGLDPAAAMVFLLAGPATNVATIGVVHKLLGRPALVAYLVSIATLSLVAGAVVGQLYGWFDLTPGSMSDRHEHGSGGPVALFSAVALTGLLLWHGLALVRRRLAG